VLTLFESVWADEANRGLFIWPDPDAAERRHNAEALMGFEAAQRVSRRASGQRRAYALEALESEAAILASTVQRRNNRLHQATRELQKFVNAGYLARNEVEGKLFDAACECGYVRTTRHEAPGILDGAVRQTPPCVPTHPAQAVRSPV
jgi:hypothetical protein